MHDLSLNDYIFFFFSWFLEPPILMANNVKLWKHTIPFKVLKLHSIQLSFSKFHLGENSPREVTTRNNFACIGFYLWKGPSRAHPGVLRFHCPGSCLASFKQFALARASDKGDAASAVWFIAKRATKFWMPAKFYAAVSSLSRLLIPLSSWLTNVTVTFRHHYFQPFNGIILFVFFPPFRGEFRLAEHVDACWLTVYIGCATTAGSMLYSLPIWLTGKAGACVWHGLRLIISRVRGFVFARSRRVFLSRSGNSGFSENINLICFIINLKSLVLPFLYALIMRDKKNAFCFEYFPKHMHLRFRFCL